MSQIISLHENVPDGDQTVTTSADDLTIVCREAHLHDRTRMCLALDDELSAREVVQAKDSRLATDGEVLV